MHMKAAIFSVIALFGTAWLFWAGYQGIDGGFLEGGQDEESERPRHQDARREHDTVRAISQRGDILSLEQILRRAGEQHAGRLLESELEQKNGAYVYEIELVDGQGRVWEMKFDARTGEMLKETQGD